MDGMIVIKGCKAMGGPGVWQVPCLQEGLSRESRPLYSMCEMWHTKVNSYVLYYDVLDYLGGGGGVKHCCLPSHK
jgi:hypothetical protein